MVYSRCLTFRAVRSTAIFAGEGYSTVKLTLISLCTTAFSVKRWNFDSALYAALRLYSMDLGFTSLIICQVSSYRRINV